MLRNVTSFWGQSHLLESDPVTQMAYNAVYVPFRPDLFFDHDPEWGVYTQYGKLITDTAYYRGPAHVLVGQSISRPDKMTALDYVDEELIYGGPLIWHYGHFLLASLARLWWKAEHPAGRMKILVHSHQSIDQWFDRDFAREIFGALQIEPRDLVVFNKPTLLRRLRVPRPAVEEQSFVHRIFGEIGSQIGQALRICGGAKRDQIFYLSKSRLDGGITKIVGESVIDECMAEMGVLVVHPQELPFVDQIRLFASARAIIGSVGSALHTSLFVETPPRIVAFTAMNSINANYALIDKVKGVDATYLYVSGPIQQTTDPRFQCAWDIGDTKVLAKDLLNYV